MIDKPNAWSSWLIDWLMVTVGMCEKRILDALGTLEPIFAVDTYSPEWLPKNSLQPRLYKNARWNTDENEQRAKATVSHRKYYLKRWRRRWPKMTRKAQPETNREPSRSTKLWRPNRDVWEDNPDDQDDPDGHDYCDGSDDTDGHTYREDHDDVDDYDDPNGYDDHDDHDNPDDQDVPDDHDDHDDHD